MQMMLSVPIPISDVAPVETMAAVALNGELGHKAGQGLVTVGKGGDLFFKSFIYLFI